MEKIKVNMSPNPLDVQTIHASQNDGEARQWEFELHNNGELIDTSDVKEQMVFKSYKGGTEQILPENTSTPTTSPFLGDIRYPQGLLTDQEFTYRQSPTEEDGLAKITDVKGNTLVWNQLVQNGNFANTANWAVGGTSFTVANNEATFIGKQYTNFSQPMQKSCIGHKVLVIATCKTDGSFSVFKIRKYTSSTTYTDSNATIPTSYQTLTQLITLDSNLTGITVIFQNNASESSTINVKNVMLFDLTQMGLDITDPSEFTSLFPLSYYSYNAGTLLSFNGTGIKTTGKNLLPLPIEETKNGITLTHNDDGSITLKGTATALTYFDFSTNFDSSKYAGCLFTCRKASQDTVSGVLCRISQSNRVGIQDLYIGNNETEVQDNGEGLYFAIRVADGTTMPTNGYTLYPMLRMPNQDSTFEPYTLSTLSLPISTYFPSGMKSAGSVCDELTENKAINRIGAVDLGSLNWTYASDAGHLRFVSSTISPNAKLPAVNTIANAVCTKYGIVTEGNVYNNQKVGLCIISNSRAMVYDPNYTDATAFKTAMSGVYLYYELATPTETSFTTASLVTENAEIPLSNNDGTLIGKCTEQLSENPGFIDAKIKLSDSDGDVYSNKLQLHIERSPQ